ncbi:MAG: phosphoglucomutase/phosphomannomutase family protein [Acidobacteriaceae bacterium]
MTQIKFGTDGWRGIIADDFTFEGVRQCAAATADYVTKHEDPSKGLVVGYDTRFLSREFARAAAEVIAASGINVILSDDYAATPAVSYAVKHRGLAGGVMITSSHNPPQWNGYKYKANYGGSGRPAIIKAIESELGNPAPKPGKPCTITEADLKADYVAALKNFVDLNAIKSSGMKFGIDTMYGSGRGILASIFDEAGIPYAAIRGELNPLFPGINPEPIEPHTHGCQQMVVREGCSAGLITDGDADRIGACDEHGNYVTSHMIFAVILRWLLERKGWSGDVVRAFNTTKMLDRIAARHGRKLLECGIGFKHICDLMLAQDILVGGEESGGIGISRHLPERDGILNSLILAQIMADEKRTLGQLVSDLFAEYGAHYYGRIDLHIANDIKESAIARAHAGVADFAGHGVLRTEDMDGVKFFLEDPAANSDPKRAEAWLLLRASGTEPLLRIYSEAGSPELVQQLLNAGRDFTLGKSTA